IMKLCVELYCKNPHVLDPLRKVICLSSNRTIRHLKNKVEQKPGWNSAMLKWCLEEAKKNHLREQDFWGGEDVEMVVKDGKHRLVGFVDLGKIHDDMQTLSGASEEPKLASHVLQFIFLGDSGFRFPIAQFPSSSCTASGLQFIFWNGVKKMLETGFTIYYCILDGAEVNRQFIKIHFTDENEAINNRFICPNPYNYSCPMVFLMDPKHNFKKLRNNILKSVIDGSSTRCLTIGTNHILWEHFRNAFNYDQGSFSMSFNEKLTAEHFDLTPASKMRNHLAEDVLDKKMLSLMKAYKDHLRNKPGQNENSLDATIALLNHSSKMVQLFNDKYTLSSVTDSRLKELRQFLKFIDDWKCSTEGDAKKFISPKLYFDLQSMVHGFQAIVSIKTMFHQSAIVKPGIINQDVVENHFCQIRACNGQNNNPTWRLQEATQNTIRYGQTTISRKSNAGALSLKGANQRK
ncbi:hypothetical protein QZH41_010671, partial [Actinostola sp. cb2023]